MSIQLNIERLLAYGFKKNFISEWDVIPTRNALLDLLQVAEPYTGDDIIIAEDTPVDILNDILDYCAEQGIIEDNTTTLRDLMDARIMGLIMPRQSGVVARYQNTTKEKGVKEAVDNFYAMSKNSNYIRMDRIAKNLYWKGETPYGDLEITINLSKPEKDPKEIEKAKLMPQASYPKCLLCVDNVGYAGRLNHPGRQNHRVLPLTLKDERWYFQYSPYVYYNEHSIIFNGDHTPMKISINTFKRLMDFIDTIPHYFIGSNADLPIVGGSILSHDHFQGGNHTFPMEVAAEREKFVHDDFKDVRAAIVDWQMSVVRISSQNKEQLITMADKILCAWREYSDEQVDILSHSGQDSERIPHNTITPIARRNKQGLYEIDLVLRNNRRTEEYPDGIFHPHPHLHHIKKENIGLIEVMGLAVLPGRLKTELELIKGILTNKVDFEQLNDQEKASVEKHLPWIDEINKKIDNNLCEADAEALLQDEVTAKFSQVLECAGVYKRDEKGQEAFRRFMEYLGFK
ncbi:UDP-glucose--hexose-1-phosphate uridylyltransferase [Vallitalea okinawensis]|uniref:UDP-glucose--hexose-1-phosphate uridylyltransferase n=1 Tax=Vallitalea okinawensis TaxID=2078660 RepID=UPI000CFCF6EA|nr:UDP-glucose--hexose-1-phosphate uridylyltransferase [Vallitalea okinawensis]